MIFTKRKCFEKIEKIRILIGNQNDPQEILSHCVQQIRKTDLVLGEAGYYADSSNRYQ